MNIFSRKTRALIIITSLLLVVIFVVLILPTTATFAQTESSPTPTSITNNEQVLSSGDSEGLILGAGIILFIILGGVILQRIILKNADQHTRE
jgi:hypothetical protein